MLFRYIISLFTIVFLGLLISCSSPQKLLEKGNYEKAYTSALKSLKKGSKNRKDRNTLSKAFNEILKEKESQAKILANTNYVDEWEEAYIIYDELIDDYNRGSLYLNNDYATVMSGIQDQQNVLTMDLAENLHKLGNDSYALYVKNGDKRAAQDAFLQYEKAAYYNPDFPGIDKAMDESYEAGVVRLLIRARAAFSGLSQWDLDRKFQDLERKSKRFLEVYFDKNIATDCSIDFSFDIESNDRIVEGRERYSKEIEDGYTTQRDTSGAEIRVPVYRSVTASVVNRRTERTYVMRSIGETYGNSFCGYKTRRFEQVNVESINEYIIEGDSRAVDRQLDNNQTFRSESIILGELLDKIYYDMEREYF